MMYIFLAVFFGSAIVNTLLPKLNGRQTKTTLVAAIAADSTVAPIVKSSSDSAKPDIEAAVAIAAVRNSDQLSAGFMEHGSFSQTKLGASLLKYVEIWAFWILTVAFLVDLIVCARTSTVDLHLTKNHKQYLAGILALFLTGVCLSTQFLFRMYSNRDFRVDSKMILACLLQWAISAGCGGFLYGLTTSVILICLFCFAPGAVYLGAYGYAEWLKNDFQLYLDSIADAQPQAPGAGGKKREDKLEELAKAGVTAGEEEKKQDVAINVSTPASEVRPKSAVGSSALSRHLSQPKMEGVKEFDVDLGKYNGYKKYKIIVSWLMAGAIVTGMGATIASKVDPAWIGYTITAVILILASTALPIIEWFNSLQISKNMIVNLILTTVFFLAFILIFWIQGLDKANDNRSLALLFTLFIYPTMVVLAFALLKWRDDKWVMGSFVRTALTVCCALITTFLIVVAVVYDPWEIGAALLVAFMVILFGSFLVPVLVARFPWLIKWAIICGIAVLIAFAAGVGSQPNNGFVGFSIAWGILFSCFAVAAYQAHRNTSNVNVISHLYSPNIFPVFKYDLAPGLRNPLKPDDKRVYLVILTLLIACLWGVLAVFFLEPTWVGLGVHAISIVLLIIYAYECMTQPRILLARAVRFLGEGSATYKDAVHRAKLAAFKAQLTSIKSTSTSLDQQIPSSPAPVYIPSDEHAPPSRQLTIAEEAAVKANQDLLLLDEDDMRLLGLDDPNKPLNELDWRGLYNIFVQLRSATPPVSLTAFAKGDAVDVATITWSGQTLTRRRCHALLLRLDHHIAELHTNFLSYSTQIQVELILGVQGIKAEQEASVRGFIATENVILLCRPLTFHCVASLLLFTAK
jgi:hypothetical protein